jgi:hypothetical protein
MALALAISSHMDVPLESILPGHALGAVVLTGDDDQAYLEKYAEQLTLIGDTPITYFLHPLTRHDRRSLVRMKKQHKVNFGIHPDALDAPQRYPELLREQIRWYRHIVGDAPTELRNHGFLSDGYWGHLEHWMNYGIRTSANLPGVDGRVINGSLLPARMYWNGVLTPHWSVLTPLGDGMRFALGMSDQTAAQRIVEFADRIRSDHLPGVIVINLHPQNVAETRAMHGAILEIVRAGFLAWSLRDCIEWFSFRDSGHSISPISRLRHWWAKLAPSAHTRFFASS